MAEIVPVGDPGREHRALRCDIDEALVRVAASGVYVMGPEHDRFEQEFAASIGAAHGVAVANGTDALELALRGVGCGPGDVVVTVANAGGYAATAIAAIGATPRFVDVRDEDLLADPDRVEEALPGAAAVVLTHLYGRLHPDAARLAAACAAAGVALVEDAAQCTGARRGGRGAGSFGDAAAHSFYPTKNLGALGDGGMVTTQAAAVAERVRALRQYGWTERHVRAVPGGRNSRLDEIQAAVLRVKLAHVAELVARRRSVAAAVRAAAPDRWWSGVPGEDDAAHLLVTRTSDRDRFRRDAAAAGIATAVHFPHPDHRSTDGGAARELPVTERAAGEVVTVPCHPYLTDQEIARVASFAASAV